MEDYREIHFLQQRHMDEDPYKEGNEAVHRSWFSEDTADFWRHKRMYETIGPLASFYRDSKWLSIGDGRYGLDSVRLRKMFGIDVLPTDISCNMLEKSKKEGIIRDYKVENAEQLTLPDKSYDISFCKESFHHFPRPIIALYEMIRVSKEAVILIEPNDMYSLSRPKIFLKRLVPFSRLFSKYTNTAKQHQLFYESDHAFEESSNYIYRLSKREVLKIVHGLNLKGVAWKGFNDCYIEGCEFEPSDPTNKVFAKICKKIKKLDMKCKWLPLFYDWEMITIILFIREIHEDLKASMESTGYHFPSIVSNPYV